MSEVNCLFFLRRLELIRCSSDSIESSSQNSTDITVTEVSATPTTSLTPSLIAISNPTYTASYTPTAFLSNPSPAPSSQCQSQPNYNGTLLTPLDTTGHSIPLANEDQTFAVLCKTDFPSGPPNDRHDIMKLEAVNPYMCAVYCAEYNAGLEKMIFNGIIGADGGPGGFCRAISLVLAVGEFCYLKNGTGVGGTDTSSSSVQVASAVLISNIP